MTRACIITMAVLFTALFMFSCERDKELEPDVLARVNNEDIHYADLQLYWNALPPDQKEDYAGPEGVRRLLKEAVTWRLMAQEAERLGLDKGPSVERQLRIHRQQVLVNALLDQAVTESEIYKYYQDNFIRTAFILLEFPENAGEAEKSKVGKKARELYEKLAEEDADFGELARKHSDAPNAANRGDMGYVTHETVTNMAGFLAAESVFGLKGPGDVTEPVKGDDGYYIFKLIEAPGNLDPRGLDPKLMQALRERRREQAINAYQNELNSREENQIVYNQKSIRELMEAVKETMDAINAGPAMGTTLAPSDTVMPAPEVEVPTGE